MSPYLIPKGRKVSGTVKELDIIIHDGGISQCMNVIF